MGFTKFRHLLQFFQIILFLVKTIWPKKEKAQDDYVCIYECGKKLCTSTFKLGCAEQEINISQINKMLESFNSKTK